MRIMYFVVKEVINARSRVTALTVMRVVMDLYILRKSQGPNCTPHARESVFHLSPSSYFISSTQGNQLLTHYLRQ
jgi:hypothetical protein